MAIEVRPGRFVTSSFSASRSCSISSPMNIRPVCPCSPYDSSVSDSFEICRNLPGHFLSIAIAMKLDKWTNFLADIARQYTSTYRTSRLNMISFIIFGYENGEVLIMPLKCRNARTFASLTIHANGAPNVRVKVRPNPSRIFHACTCSR